MTRSEKDLVGLVYELLDAHDDTVRLAGALVVDERWRHISTIYAICSAWRGNRSLERAGANAASWRRSESTQQATP